MKAKTTPDVPMVDETMPGSTMPLPTPPAAWSPPPPTTGVPAGRPVSCRRRADDLALATGDSYTGGTRLGVEAQRREHLLRPACGWCTSNSVVPEASDTSRGELAGQAEADVVLGQQELARLGEDLRLVVAHPEDLGRAEAGERRVAGQLDRPVAPDRVVIQSHCAWLRWSHQMRLGRSTLLSLSSRTTPCIWPDRPMP